MALLYRLKPPCNRYELYRTYKSLMKSRAFYKLLIVFKQKQNVMKQINFRIKYGFFSFKIHL